MSDQLGMANDYREMHDLREHQGLEDLEAVTAELKAQHEGIIARMGFTSELIESELDTHLDQVKLVHCLADLRARILKAYDLAEREFGHLDPFGQEPAGDSPEPGDPLN
jgi:predicted glycoside hydrolase/deacetylase ChbG (UPF0249 family)